MNDTLVCRCFARVAPVSSQALLHTSKLGFAHGRGVSGRNPFLIFQYHARIERIGQHLVERGDRKWFSRLDRSPFSLTIPSVFRSVYPLQSISSNA